VRQEIDKKLELLKILSLAGDKKPHVADSPNLTISGSLPVL